MGDNPASGPSPGKTKKTPVSQIETSGRVKQSPGRPWPGRMMPSCIPSATATRTMQAPYVALVVIAALTADNGLWGNLVIKTLLTE